MPGIRLKIDKTEMNKVLEGVTDRMTDSSPAMRKIGSLVKESVRTNFARGGRPVSWAKLKTRHGQPLRDSNRLMNSITREAKKDSVKVGTNVVYAAVHHFGARKHSFGSFAFTVAEHARTIARGKNKGKKTTVRQHRRTVKLPWGNIPARPFMLLQQEDVPEIQTILAKHIIQGEGA